MANADHEQNRKLWDEIADVHFRHPDYKVREFLEGWNSLRTIERDLLGDVTEKSLLHLFCQFGLDTLSWARLGATVTGVDISGRSIQLARDLARRAGIEAEFVEADVVDLVGVMDKRFDIVFQSYGTHHWIGDLERWAGVVGHYLKPGGTFLIVDFHPVAGAFLSNQPYFDRGPHRCNDPDYCDRAYVPQEESVEWQHPLGAIVNAVIGAGLTVDRLEEYDVFAYRRHEDWVAEGPYFRPPGDGVTYPLMFSLMAHQ